MGKKWWGRPANDNHDRHREEMDHRRALTFLRLDELNQGIRLTLEYHDVPPAVRSEVGEFLRQAEAIHAELYRDMAELAKLPGAAKAVGYGKEKCGPEPEI